MLLFLAQLALATPQALHELEVARAPVAQLAEHLDGDTELQALTALARSADAEALPLITPLLDDDRLAVRIAAARALGWIPGSAATIRDRFDATAKPLPGPRAYPSDDVRRALIWSMGRQGEPQDVVRLSNELAAPSPYATQAALALGRMGRRKVEGADQAVAALVPLLSRFDRALVTAAAFAIYRIGLAQASEADLAAVQAMSSAASTPSARAWLLKAAWDRGERGALLAAGTTDVDQLVRAAAAQAVQDGDHAAALRPLLGDPWPQVRLAAARALARLGDAEGRAALPALERQELDLADADAEDLIAAALDKDSAAARTAAAGTLLGRDDVPDDAGSRLLLAKDSAIREAALELIARGEISDAVALSLLQHVRVEDSPEVITGALQQVVKALDPDRTPTPAMVDAASRALPRLLGHDSSRVRTAASQLATRLDLPSAPTNSAVRHADLAKLQGVLGADVTTPHGEFRIDLYPDVAPLAVANFVALADAGAFDGKSFHRVVPGFVVQGGCPRGDGWGGPGWTIADEVSALPYVEGAVGMARAAPDTGGSQWFVTLTDNPHLDGDYTLFGRVVHGMSVARMIEPGDTMAVRIERAP